MTIYVVVEHMGAVVTVHRTAFRTFAAAERCKRRRERMTQGRVVQVRALQLPTDRKA